MSMSSVGPSPVRTPIWARSTRPLEIATLVITAVATAVGWVIAGRESSIAGFATSTLMAAGVWVGYRYRPYLGQVIVVAAPLAAAVTGWPPIHNWSIACFAAFLFTVRGLPGLVTGLTIAASNFLASTIAAGTIMVDANPEASIAAAAALVAAATGSALRGQRQYTAELEQRTQEAIATREAAVNRSVAEERLRIARDLHDSVGHNIAVVNMHLGAAEVHLDTDQSAVQEDVRAARIGIQEVLRETQEILRVLRVGPGKDTVDPTPSHERIPELVDSFRRAGLDVEVSATGLDRHLSSAASTAAFRVVQEALTNAERHGGGTVGLTVTMDESLAVIEVVNPRRQDGIDTSGGGNGLVGMRERVESARGRLDVRSDDRFFTIAARIPTGGESDL